jgi:hypothetical protein
LKDFQHLELLQAFRLKISLIPEIHFELFVY